MRHDPIAALYYGDGQLDCYREFGLVAVDPAEPDRPVARAFSVPFAFRDGTRGREELPDGGWDAVICWADEDRRAGRPATAISALEIMVVPQRTHLSGWLSESRQEWTSQDKSGHWIIGAPLLQKIRTPPFARTLIRAGCRCKLVGYDTVFTT